MFEKKSPTKSTKNGDSSLKNSIKRTNSKKKPRDGYKSSQKKKSSVSFNISPRVERIPNPKKTSIKPSQDAVVSSLNESHTSYVPFEEETSLPELSQAVIHKKMDKMLHLLDTRPMNYVCVTDRRNRNCLHYSAYLGYTEILETLLNRTDSHKILNAKDEAGKTPLFKALETSSLTCVEILLKKGADVSLQDNDGISVMHVAALANNIVLMRLLWKNKADLNTKDKFGFTPLHLTAGLGLKDPTLFLLRHGADIDPIDVKGRTPLLAASADNNVDVIELLLEHGANPTIQDSKGRTAKNVFSSMDRRFSDIQPTRTVSSHHFPFEMERWRTNSFIDDIRKVHDESVTDIMSSRRGSAATTPKFVNDEIFTKFTFDEKHIADFQTEGQKPDKNETSSYRDLVSPINWKNILQSPRRIKKCFTRSDANKWTHKPSSSSSSITNKRSSLKKPKNLLIHEEVVVPALDLGLTSAEEAFESYRSQPQLLNRNQLEFTHSNKQPIQNFQPSQSPLLLQRSLSNPQLDKCFDETGRPPSCLSQRSINSLNQSTGFLEQPQIQQTMQLNSPLPTHQLSQQPQLSSVGLLQHSNQVPFNQSPSFLNESNEGARRQLNRSASQLSQYQESVHPDVQLNQQLQQISLSASQLSQQLQHSIQSRLTTNSTQPQNPMAVPQSPSPFLPAYQQIPFQPLQPQLAPTFVQSQPTSLIQPPQPHLMMQPPPLHNPHLSLHSNPSTSQHEALQPPASHTTTRLQSPNLKHRSNESQLLKEKGCEDSSCQPQLSEAFEEDRYLYMCLKNRELLLKKIKQCETLESEIKDLKNDETSHKNVSSEQVIKDASLLDENSALRDELRELKKENLDLNEHILFNKKISNKSQSRSQSRGRSRSRSRSNSKRRKSKKHTTHNVESLQHDLERQEGEDLTDAGNLNQPRISDQKQGSSSDDSHLEGDQRREPQRRRKAYDHNPTKSVIDNIGDEEFSSIEYDYEGGDDSSEYSYAEGDSYFQETINKLLKENILLKRSHKAYERCHKELEDECEEHKLTIKQLQDELADEQEMRKQVETDFGEFKKAHIALEQAHVELDYGMKKMLEDNVDMRKNLNFLQTSKTNTNNLPQQLAASGRSSFRKTLDKLTSQRDIGKRVPPKRPDPPTRPTSAAYSSAGDKTPNPSSTSTSNKPSKPPPFEKRRERDTPGSSNNARSKGSAAKKPLKKKKRKKMFILF